jgi:nucleotide-binding universal stress UspA family protein
LICSLDDRESVVASLRENVRRSLQYLRQLLHQRVALFRTWIENTENMLHLVVIFFVPVLLAFVTWLANVTPVLTFLVYPPLASGTYTLFADPESKYASPKRFVGGMTLGALCGWAALTLNPQLLLAGPIGQVQAEATALSIFLTGLCTWALDLEMPSAFSTALLVLVSGADTAVGADTPVFVGGIVVSSAIVAGVYSLWHDLFYERRAEYLFQTVKGDDHVLVPIRHEGDDETALFAAYLAAAHDAGKLVLFDAIGGGELPLQTDGGRTDYGHQQRRGTFDTTPERDHPEDVPQDVLDRLTEIEEYVESTMDLPCEMVVTRGRRDNPQVAIRTARRVNCDLIVSSYGQSTGDTLELSPYVNGLMSGPIDTIAFSSAQRQTSWSRILVMVNDRGELAHAMLDFAQRLAPRPRTISVCTCIAESSERHRAESILDDLVSSFDGQFETRVSYGTVPDYLADTSQRYDLAMIGASTGRSKASRFVTPPTVEQLETVDCDLAIVHSG